MKKTLKLTPIIILSVVILSVSMLSCIKEDLSDCNKPPLAEMVCPDVQIVEAEGHNILEDSIHTATLFVFDSDDNFVARWEFPDKPQLHTTYTPDLKLPPANYNFVVWTNLYAPFIDQLVSGKTRTQSALMLDIPTSKNVDENTMHFPWLFYGHLDNEAVVQDNYLVTIPLQQLTNILNVKLTGVREKQLAYKVTVHDNNGAYRYNGDFADFEPFTYSSGGAFDGDTLKSIITVLKLAKTKSDVVFAIEKTTGEQVFPPTTGNRINLIDWILKANPNNDFEKTHFYEILIDPETFETTINGWNANVTELIFN